MTIYGVIGCIECRLDLLLVPYSVLVTIPKSNWGLYGDVATKETVAEVVQRGWL